MVPSSFRPLKPLLAACHTAPASAMHIVKKPRQADQLQLQPSQVNIQPSVQGQSWVITKQARAAPAPSGCISMQRLAEYTVL